MWPVKDRVCLVRMASPIEAIERGPAFCSLTNSELLRFRLRRAVNDVCELTLYGYAGGPGVAQPQWRTGLKSVDAAVAAAQAYERAGVGRRTGSAFERWLLRVVLPSAMREMFEASLPAHHAFLEVLPELQSDASLHAFDEEEEEDEEDAEQDAAEGADALADRLLSRAVPWGRLDARVLALAAEGFLRAQLASGRPPDHVLLTGYEVQFSARSFGDWFELELLPRTIRQCAQMFVSNSPPTASRSKMGAVQPRGLQRLQCAGLIPISRHSWGNSNNV
jgi:hypothetical protein